MTEKEYIDREAIIKKLHEIGGCDASSDWEEGFDKAVEVAIKVAEKLPAADVAPVKHGHWGNISESCSVCGNHWAEGMVMNADDWGYFDPMPAYCLYCGAKMDGGDT